MRRLNFWQLYFGLLSALNGALMALRPTWMATLSFAVCLAVITIERWRGERSDPGEQAVLAELVARVQQLEIQQLRVRNELGLGALG